MMFIVMLCVYGETSSGGKGEVDLVGIGISDFVDRQALRAVLTTNKPIVQGHRKGQERMATNNQVTLLLIGLTIRTLKSFISPRPRMPRVFHLNQFAFQKLASRNPCPLLICLNCLN